VSWAARLMLARFLDKEDGVVRLVRAEQVGLHMRPSLAHLLDDAGVWGGFWRTRQHSSVIGLRD
jgi:hypothetical protein